MTLADTPSTARDFPIERVLGVSFFPRPTPTHAAAEETADVIRATLRARLSEQGGQSDAVTQPPSVIVGHRESNSLIVSAPEDRLAAIRELVAELDRR